jgi:hypothetical protein
LRNVATRASAPKIALDPAIRSLTGLSPGPRPHTLFVADYDTAGMAACLGVLDVSTGKLERLDVPVDGSMVDGLGGLLPDGKRAIVVGKEGLLVYDLDSKTSRPLPGCVRGQGILLSGDGRTLVVVRDIYDGDVWLGESR